MAWNERGMKSEKENSLKAADVITMSLKSIQENENKQAWIYEMSKGPSFV